MNKHDEQWQNLLALSAPSFAGDEAPPFGFTTRTMARWREESRQWEVMERIGWRALFASIAILALTAGATTAINYFASSDLEPGVSNLVQIERVQVS
jgi:hypothetical protein